MLMSLPVSAFSKELLPTFGRPTIAMTGSCGTIAASLTTVTSIINSQYCIGRREFVILQPHGRLLGHVIRSISPERRERDARKGAAYAQCRGYSCRQRPAGSLHHPRHDRADGHAENESIQARRANR